MINFDFIQDGNLRNDLKATYEVLSDVELDLMRYMCSISCDDIYIMIENNEFSCEINTLLSYSKISKNNTSIVLNSMHSICWSGFNIWKATTIVDNTIQTSFPSPRTQSIINELNRDD